MEVSVSDAKAQLTDLVRQAEAGEEVILTRHGQRVARLVGEPQVDLRARTLAIREISERASKRAKPGPCAARSQDFLYDEAGLPK